MLASLLLCLAPVPPPVVPSTPAHLVGEWQFSWGQRSDGRIVFNADGTYVSRHSPLPDSGWSYVGRWEWDGRTLVLHETGYYEGWEGRALTRYVVEFERPKGYHLTGTSGGMVTVVLSKIPPEV